MPEAPSLPIDVLISPSLADIRKSQNHLLERIGITEPFMSETRLRASTGSPFEPKIGFSRWGTGGSDHRNFRCCSSRAQRSHGRRGRSRGAGAPLLRDRRRGASHTGRGHYPRDPHPRIAYPNRGLGGGCRCPRKVLPKRPAREHRSPGQPLHRSGVAHRG